MGKKEEVPHFDRELSWLAFNGRVLQEAKDPSVPLFERIAFLAIFSSNLDEFFRVRVASLRSLLRLKKKSIAELGFNPRRLLQQIHQVVTRQQEEFGEVFRNAILPALEAHDIHLLDESRVTAAQGEYLRRFFNEEVRSHLHPVVLSREEATEETQFLKNRGIYLVAELWPKAETVRVAAFEARYGLVEVPSPPLERFVELPDEGARHNVLFLDDVIRYNLRSLFPGYDVGSAYAVKLTRDAELYLDDEFGDSVVEKIRKALGKRDKGVPSRFLYDLQTPYVLITFMKAAFGLEDEDLVLGGRYHNLHDLFGFPRFGKEELSYPPLPPLPHPELEGAPSIFDKVAERDRLLHFPYQKFDYVLQFLDEAAADPDVEELWITLYRVADDSGVAQALIRAAENGKKVTAFVEVKARFDEASNLHWAERMEKAGVRVLYSMPDLKVHTKLFLIARREGKKRRLYAYLGTGNFNEKTARFYTDSALLTADRRLTKDVRSVFAFLCDEEEKPAIKHLLMAPFYLRKGFYKLIDREVAHAEAGQAARFTAKMNALEDEKIIARLYEASRAGVQIDLIVRGLCCLVPGVAGQSENIRVRSIVDRFLEHPRVFLFHNNGEEELYLASADWMTRNLSRRVEVAFPIYDEAHRAELKQILALQQADNTKARLIDAKQRNRYARDGGPPVRAQLDTYRMLEAKVAAVEG